MMGWLSDRVVVLDSLYIKKRVAQWLLLWLVGYTVMTTHLVNIIVGEGGGVLDGLYIEKKKEQPEGCSRGQWGPSHTWW